MRRKHSGIYDLASNANLLGSSPMAIRGIRKHLQVAEAFHYPDDSGFLEALARAGGGLFGKDHYFAANGCTELIEMICRLFLKPGDEVIVSRPGHPFYSRFASLAGARVVQVPLDLIDFSVDPPAIFRAINDQTRIVFLASPNDPTGAICRPREMEELLRELPPRVIVVYDETYRDYITDKEHARAEDYLDKGRTLIGLHSFSPAYGLGSLRLGYALSDPETIHLLNEGSRPYPVNSLSLAAGIAALDDQDFLAQGIAKTNREKRWLYTAMKHTGLPFWRSEGNFFLVRTPYDSAYFTEQLLKLGIRVRRGDDFGARDSIRVSIGYRDANKALIQALIKLNPKSKKEQDTIH